MSRKRDRTVKGSANRRTPTGSRLAQAIDATEQSGFALRSPRTRLLFEDMVEAFVDDYMRKRRPSDDSGWRGLGQLAKMLRVSPSTMYGKHGGLSPELGELVRMGLVEARIFQGERGRGGEVTRLRVCYEKDPVRDYVRDYVTDRVRGASREEATGRMALPGSRVAVLPFVNLSPDPGNEYFADGMTEELIDRLAQVKQLRVIARTSVMSYKGEKKKASQIARELEVGGLVEGSVMKAGNRVRVTVQLLSGGTEEQLWSSRYDESLDDIFDVQSEIAEKVVGELKVQLLQSEREALKRKPTANMEAYEDFLRGMVLYREWTETSARQAVKVFKRAVELDPSFARAHAAVARCHLTLANYGWEPYDVMLPAVKASLKRALELDPDLAEAHASLAGLHYWEEDSPGAEVEARKALELDPGLADAYNDLAFIAGDRGDPDEMVRDMEAAYHLDPIDPRYIRVMGQLYFATGREREALEHCRKTELLEPAGTYRNMSEYHLSKGDIAKAREFHAKVEKLRPADPWVIYMGGVIDATAGDREKALRAIRKLEERKMGPVAYNYAAYVYHALGDLTRYFESLNGALDEHIMNPSIMMYSPLLAKSREDPRYGELVEKFRMSTGLAD